jgi:hypothetical protein
MRPDQQKLPERVIIFNDQNRSRSGHDIFPGDDPEIVFVTD